MKSLWKTMFISAVVTNSILGASEWICQGSSTVGNYTTMSFFNKSIKRQDGNIFYWSKVYDKKKLVAKSLYLNKLSLQSVKEKINAGYIPPIMKTGKYHSGAQEEKEDLGILVNVTAWEIIASDNSISPDFTYYCECDPAENRYRILHLTSKSKKGAIVQDMPNAEWRYYSPDGDQATMLEIIVNEQW